MAAIQYFIPGWGFINETTNTQFFIAGWGFSNSVSVIAPVYGFNKTISVWVE